MTKEGIFLKLKTAITEGETDEAASLTKEAMELKVPIRDILEYVSEVVAGLGKQYEEFNCFIPQLVLASEAMDASLDTLEVQLKNLPPRQTVLLGTVEGDVHDIGKRIVGCLLKSKGFKVTDLGRDVPAAEFAQKAKEIGADVIGASSFLYAQIPEFNRIVEACKESGIRDKVKILIGGIAASENWANEADADGYGKDAFAALEIVKELLSTKEVEK